MEVLNIHERELEADPVRVGALIDSLSSPQDRLWPTHTWPKMAFDRPLVPGAAGGYGPIRYFVEQYAPGKSIRFRFTGPKGFDGFLEFEIIGTSKQSTLLRYTPRMHARGQTILSWPLLYRPMHDALLEDSLTVSQVSLGLTPQIRARSLWVIDIVFPLHPIRFSGAAPAKPLGSARERLIVQRRPHAWRSRSGGFAWSMPLTPSPCSSSFAPTSWMPSGLATWKAG